MFPWTNFPPMNCRNFRIHLMIIHTLHRITFIKGES
jgi:hypothetical protein